MNIQPRSTCRFNSKICEWTLACADQEFSAGGVLRLLMGRKESNQTNIPTDILMCGSRGRGGVRPHSHGKSKVIRVSIEISIWTPPGKCWTP